MSDLGPNGPTATHDALAGTDWEIVSIDGAPVPASEPMVIGFGHDGRVSGSTGLNRLTASYSLTADYLTIGPLATSRRAGSPEQMALEHRVVASLAGMCPFRLTARDLSFDGPLGRVALARVGAPVVVAPGAGAEDPPG